MSNGCEAVVLRANLMTDIWEINVTSLSNCFISFLYVMDEDLLDFEEFISTSESAVFDSTSQQEIILVKLTNV